MKTFYRITNLILTNLLSIVFGFIFGSVAVLAKQEKDRAVNEAKAEPKIVKTENKSERTDGRKRVVGFSYDEAEG